MFSAVPIIHESCLAGVRAVQIHKPESLVTSKVSQEIFNKIIFVTEVDNASKNPFIISTLDLTLKETDCFSPDWLTCFQTLPQRCKWIQHMALVGQFLPNQHESDLEGKTNSLWLSRSHLACEVSCTATSLMPFQAAWNTWPKPNRQCCNAFVLLSVVGTELNHPVGYLHRSPAGLSETKHEAWEPHNSHPCAECTKCSVSHGATHPLLTQPAPAREDPQTAGHNELNHAPTRKTDNSAFFTNPRRPGCEILSQEGLLRSQKGWKNAALLPSSLFYWYTTAHPTIKAIANLFLPGRWGKGPRSRQKSCAKQPNNVQRAPQSLPHACTEEQKENEKSKEVVSGVCLQLNHPSENQ